MPLTTECRLDVFLTDQLGLAPEYVRDRIQSLFLEGKPVDDTARAVVAPGARLALSAAMPGLVGAMLRKGGYYASLRRSISLDERPRGEPSPRGATVTVKLFNMIARELGPDLLQGGIWLDGQKLHGFFDRHWEDLQPGIGAVSLNGRPLPADQIPQIGWGPAPVRLQVSIEAG